MTIFLNHIIPKYLDRRESEVWGKEIVIQKGEHVNIVAPSGSGKTTLVHFLYRLRSDYEGEINIDKRKLKETGIEEMAQIRQNKLSIVFQDLRLFPELTIEENIEIKRVLNPYRKKEEIPAMAERLGIGRQWNQKARICSYGEQQRAAIIRALMQPFDFLLLDEPFSHLDAHNSAKAWELITEECAKRRASMILADLHEISIPAPIKILHL